MISRRSLLTLGLALATVGGTAFLAWKFSSSSRTPVILKVGGFEFTLREIALRDQLSSVFYPQGPRDAARIQLIEAFSAAEIMARHGQPITEAQLEAEAERIEKTTREPAVLQRIQRLFSGDRDAYLKIFVLPVLSMRSIHDDLFKKTPNFQSESREKAQSLLDQLLTSSRSASLLDVARKKGLPYSRWVLFRDPQHASYRMKYIELSDSPSRLTEEQVEMVTREQIDSPDAGIPGAEEWANVFHAAAVSLQPGKILDRLVEDHDDWLIVRMLKVGVSKDRWDFEGMQVPKLGFGEWFEAERKSIRVESFEVLQGT